MRYRWISYNDSYESLLESWMDDEAKRFTGCTDGWKEFYQYWICEENIRLGENFWALLACEADVPRIVFVIAETDGLFTFSECIADPQIRGRGIGKSALTELLRHSEIILGKNVREALAVIFPENAASQKIFTYAGFRYTDTHPDGDAMYFTYAEPMVCFCGHDCARCVTRLASRLGMDSLRERTVRYYRDTFGQEVSGENVHCLGGRTDSIFCLCAECPFARCCREKGIESCRECRSPCADYRKYKEKYVNRCHQI